MPGVHSQSVDACRHAVHCSRDPASGALAAACSCCEARVCCSYAAEAASAVHEDIVLGQDGCDKLVGGAVSDVLLCEGQN
eukprot:12356147-Heterocapsa_arctica.AAC.1